MEVIAITRTATDGNNIEFLQKIDLPIPVTIGHDLLVEVKAISINPVDIKVHEDFNADVPRVLDWDAVGMVKSVGEVVTLFPPSDEVWYAGALDRAGSNNEFQLIDEHITTLKPRILDNTSAATLPLTAITAWEMLFDRLGAEENSNKDDVLLVVGATGDVGPVLTQLASKLTKMIVISIASRPQSQKWVREAGTHHVIDHSKPLTEELARIGVREVTHVISLSNTKQHYSQIITALAPQGKLAPINDPRTLGAHPLKAKSILLHWESMFTRSMFTTRDIVAQHQLLIHVAQLIDGNTLHTTLGEHFGVITATNLQKAHTQIETGRSVDKTMLEGF